MICVLMFLLSTSLVRHILRLLSGLSGCDGRLVSASDVQPQDRGFDSRVSQLAHQKRPTWATGDDNVDSTVNEYMAIDRDGVSTWIARGPLKRVIGCILLRKSSR